MAEQAVSRKQNANAIRALSMDAVQKAKSGSAGALVRFPKAQSWQSEVV